MMNEQELRDRLDTMDLPPTRLQVQALVDAGRRRVLRRRAVLASCGVALAVGLLFAVPALVFRPADESAPQIVGPAANGSTKECGVTKLAVPAAMKAVSAEAVDPTGTYIVGNNTRGQQRSTSLKSDTIDLTQPVLWTDGRPQALPLIGKSTWASAVNAGGVVVGLSGDRKWTSVVRYVNGVPVKLTAPAGEWIFQPYPKINARGDVLATAKPKADPSGKGVVLLWKAGADKATRLSLPAGAEGADITDDGTIVGIVVTGSDIMDLTPYAWDENGKGRKLKAPIGQTGAVNAAQGEWATGNLWPSGTAARWNLRTGEVIDLNIHAPAHGVNGRGWIISDGALQRDGGAVKLAPSDGAAGEPADVSDNGTVIGSMLVDGRELGLLSAGPLSWQCGR